MNKISIIVPVYNVEKYLRECIESILSQKLEPMEIILVDDGSTDSSGAICDEYASSHSHIKVVHQKNGGLSAARNTGLSLSCGEYILFIDSDDYIGNDACSLLYGCAKTYGCEIVAADVAKVIDDRRGIELKRSLPPESVLTGEQFLLKSLKAKTYAAPVSFALYKRDLIIDNHLYFKDGIFHEDELWTPQIYLKARSVVYLPIDFYFYRYRSGSISKSSYTNYKKRCNDILRSTEYLSDIFSETDGELKIILMNYLVTLQMNALVMGRKTDGNKKFLRKNASAFKNKLKAFLYSACPSLYIRLICLLRKQPYKI